MELLSKLELVLSNPRSCAPVSSLYGKRVSKFTVSRIFYFNGKPWQLRSIKIQGIWRIFPFIIDTGGPEDRLPIISAPILNRYHLDNKPEKIAIPSPFGYSQAPLTGTWGDNRVSKIQMTDLRFNAFGNREASAIFLINYYVLTHHPKARTLADLQQLFPNSVDLNVASQEIDAQEENLDCDEWLNDQLPIDDSLFVVE
jgi:hypothetical protein